MKTTAPAKPTKESEKKVRTVKSKLETSGNEPAAAVAAAAKPETEKTSEATRAKTAAKKMVAEQVQPVEAVIAAEKVAQRAYQLWEARGRVHGFDREDWLQAEAELRN